MEKLFYFGNIIISYSVIGYVMLKAMFELYVPRYQQKWIYVAVWLGFVLLSILVYLTEIPIIKSLFCLVFIFVFEFVLFKGYSKKEMIGYGLFFFLFLLVIDSLSVILFSVVSTNTIGILKQNEWFLFISGVSNGILLLCFSNLFTRVMKRHRIEMIDIEQNAFLIALAIFEVLLSNYIMILSENSPNGIVQGFIVIGFLVFDFYLIFLFESISKKNRLEQEVVLGKQQATMQANYYATIEAQYDESQRLIHDMKNHLHTLESMYTEDERIQEEKEYTEMIYEKMNRLGSRFKADNRVLTIIINDKIKRSEELGIEIKTEVENINLDFINAFDLTTIFSNLLDNAIEACAEVEKNGRFIHMKLFKRNKFIILNIKNTINQLPVKEKNRFSSTKGQGHFGLGLKNVQRAIESYEGDIGYDYNEKVFTIKVTIPCG
ncbi:MAG: sensor histidine kinase [Eubacteriaceae bacterium]